MYSTYFGENQVNITQKAVTSLIGTKKLIYESFIRSHLLYCLSVWGGAALPTIKPLQRMVSKSWKKIGPYKMHTLNRLQKYNLLKLQDEIEIQEKKIVWKWNAKKLPKGLENLLVEKQDNLRNRRFKKIRNLRTNSLNHRLANRADSCISNLEQYRSRKTLVKKLKESIVENKYQFNCTSRNCYICST